MERRHHINYMEELTIHSDNYEVDKDTSYKYLGILEEDKLIEKEIRENVLRTETSRN